MHIVRKEVQKPLHKGIGVFTRIKIDNSYRMILNLKRLNKFIYYNHLAM